MQSGIDGAGHCRFIEIAAEERIQACGKTQWIVQAASVFDATQCHRRMILDEALDFCEMCREQVRHSCVTGLR